MKPGATTRPSASKSVSLRSSTVPTATMRPPCTPTSARTAGAPVPSTTVPPLKTRSIGRPPYWQSFGRSLPPEGARSPKHARGAVTLDVVSDGRLILGCGAGYLEAEFAALDQDFGDRNERFDAAITAMTAA